MDHDPTSNPNDNPNDRPAGPPERPPISVGQALSEARIAAGLSIEDVAATTRIRAALVQAIEHDDFSGCGGAFYARAHVRTIARLVDADADFLVQEYDRQHGPPPTSAQELAAPATLANPADAQTRRPASRWAAAAIAVVAILVIVLIGQWALHRGSDGDGNQTKPKATPSKTRAKPTPSSTHPSTSASSSTSPSKPPPPPTTTPSGIQVAVQVSVRSWVQATSSAGVEIYQGVLEAGQSKTFTDATSLTIRFGNAGGVTVSLNGQPPKRPCAETVCTVQFTPQSSTAG
ncbi:MAG TPA: helix-turn-helix domain-containing protein [Mycobacteriales bacterium]|nr:helix-turn-helix domain-containing protein [Mycobacteriales bacterium]